MAELTTYLCGRRLAHPLILASGPLSYGADGIRAAYAAGAAAVVTKTIGLQAAVNPTPHIWLGQRSSLLNTEKWSDLPPEQWLERELPALRERDGLLIASVGNSPADVAELAGPLARAGADLLEVVSYAAADTAPMVELAVGRAGIPVLAKVSANWPDLLDVVDRCVKAGAAGHHRHRFGRPGTADQRGDRPARWSPARTGTPGSRARPSSRWRCGRWPTSSCATRSRWWPWVA